MYAYVAIYSFAELGQCLLRPMTVDVVELFGDPSSTGLPVRYGCL